MRSHFRSTSWRNQKYLASKTDLENVPRMGSVSSRRNGRVFTRRVLCSFELWENCPQIP